MDSKTEFIIGCVGRPTKAKGVDTLIKAFAAADIPSSKLLIIGEDGERAAMQKIAGPNVEFTGYRSDVSRLLPTMDVFANLSLSEGGVSGAQIEAMKAGLPSVVTPVSKDIQHGREALVVGFGNVEGAAEAMRLLHSDKDLRKKLGENAKLKAAEITAFYSWEMYLNKMNVVFEQVMTPKGPRGKKV